VPTLGTKPALEPQESRYIYCARNGVHIHRSRADRHLHEQRLQMDRQCLRAGKRFLFRRPPEAGLRGDRPEAARCGGLLRDQRWLGACSPTGARSAPASIGSRILSGWNRLAPSPWPQERSRCAAARTGRLPEYRRSQGTWRRLPDVVILVRPAPANPNAVLMPQLDIPLVSMLTQTANSRSQPTWRFPARTDAVRSVQLVLGRLADASMRAATATPADQRGQREDEEGLRPRGRPPLAGPSLHPSHSSLSSPFLSSSFSPPWLRIFSKARQGNCARTRPAQE